MQQGTIGIQSPRGEPTVISIVRKVSLLLLVVMMSLSLHAQWRALGPEGGDARSLVYDPRNPDRILLGTSAGEVFLSENSGRSWRPWVHLGERDNFVLDHIVFDPTDSQTVYVAAWSIEEADGDLFRTRDGGRSWERVPGMRGKSLRAFVVSPDGRTLTAGAIDGVYRSTDMGETWARITPEDHPALRNFESLAVDPHDNDLIYAGTWHLPWKTTDGGRNWHIIKEGMISDSDVFSIIISHRNSRVVFDSACSGIYRSENQGELFHKIMGIPNSARRTRVLMQDPVNADVIYAGTTEGLYKSVDGGHTFQIITPPNFILNDVLVDPRNPKHVLLATDRGGVYVSEDAGRSFHTANAGFAHRQVGGFVSDHGTLYVSVVNDKEFGGVFASRDGGENWTQMNAGLNQRDVYALERASSGELVAATSHGILRFDSASQQWENISTIVEERPGAAGRPYRNAKGKLVTPPPAPPVLTRYEIPSRANALDVDGKSWLAATTEGLLRSTDGGRSWKPGITPGEINFVAVARRGEHAAAATSKCLFVSDDDGVTWQPLPVPDYVTLISGVAITDDGSLWLTTREGAVRYRGNAWEHLLEGLPSRNLRAIRAQGPNIVITERNSNVVYLSRDNGEHFVPSEPAGYFIALAALDGDQLFAATNYNGMLVAPQTRTESMRQPK